MQIHFIEIVARQKLKAPPEWEGASYQMILGTDACRVEGGIPRILTRGKNKGHKRWDRPLQKAIVTEMEVEAAVLAYERETGNCALCKGTGQEFAGWSAAEGTRHRPCRQCEATGKAQAQSPQPPLFGEA